MNKNTITKMLQKQQQAIAKKIVGATAYNKAVDYIIDNIKGLFFDIAMPKDEHARLDRTINKIINTAQKTKYDMIITDYIDSDAEFENASESDSDTDSDKGAQNE